MRRTFILGGLCVLALGSLSACRGLSTAETGNDNNGPGEEVEVDVEGLCDPGPAPVRRLSKREYNNIARDLLGAITNPADGFPAEEEMHGFNNNADAQSMSPVLAEMYLNAAERLSTNVLQSVQPIVSCTSEDEACAREFVEKFGARAFRRPLSAEDVESFLSMYRHWRATDTHQVAIETVTQAILQSPEFLYRLEFGRPVKGRPNLRHLDGYEVASRLSFFFLGSVPDEPLLQAAAKDELFTPEQVKAQAQRLLDDPRAKATVLDFHTQWLKLAKIDDLTKDPAYFPDFDAKLKPFMRREIETFIDDTIWSGPGDLKTLFSADYSYVNVPLARFYGIEGISGSGFQKAKLPNGLSTGLFSQSGLLAILAKPNQTSPIHRGIFVREQLLCQHIPPPPDNANIVAPEPDPTASTRERFAQHRADPSCEGCHVLMDPVGFGFEKFDGMGRYRELENGKPIDDSGEVSFTDIGKFSGVREFGVKLAQSSEAQQCVARQWFRFAQGRAELEGDRCNLDQLYTQFGSANYRIKDLMVAITQLPAFRFRNAPEVDGATHP